MRSLSDTMARMKRLRGMLPQNLRSTRLSPLGPFGRNPGQLNAWIYRPPSAPAGAPLVVVLHGCTQNAAGYDESSGWSRLADEQGLVLLYPEQQRPNNPNLCFNWFSADDTVRGKGEAKSIREMIRAVRDRHGTDPHRVFVTGLSAGGAMAAAMLATYPEVFAGGAVIAGLPFGIARSVPEAFDRMRGHGGPRVSALSDLVRAASPHSSNWPTLSVWHGSADQTVDPLNASALVEQWRGLHNAAKLPSKAELICGYPHRVWCDQNGREVIEEYSITGLGHGTPLDTGTQSHGEYAAPYMLEAGISSTRLISQFWGVVTEPSVVRDTTAFASESNPADRSPRGAEAASWSRQAPIGKTIEDALRTAGLMK